MDPKHIARVCHEANRALTQILQDVPLQPHWDDAPEEMIRSSVQGVVWRMDHPTAPASAQHDEWMRQKFADGWVLGPTKDSQAKTHPALVPYDQLAEGVKMKDKVFTAIVLSMAE
jgi:hypothetical protein